MGRGRPPPGRRPGTDGRGRRADRRQRRRHGGGRPRGGAGGLDRVGVGAGRGRRSAVGTVTAFFAPGGRRSALDDLRQAIPLVVVAGAVLGRPRRHRRRPPVLPPHGPSDDVDVERGPGHRRRAMGPAGRPVERRPRAGRPGHQPRPHGRRPARARGRPPGDGGRRRPRAADPFDRAPGVARSHGQRGRALLARPRVLAARPRPAAVADGRGPGGAGRGRRDPLWR